MLLWKSSITITPEIKKEKGANYKGRDIGPFKRLCNKCNISEIEYSSYDRMNYAEKQDFNCKICNNSSKGLKGDYSKKCSSEDCVNIIFYKRKYDMLIGVKKNTICQGCKNKKLSIFYTGKGFLYNKTDKEKIEIQLQTNKSRQKYWDEHPEQYQQLIESRTGYRTKSYLVEGLKCQGNLERLYIENLKAENKEIPVKAKGVKTSIGYYFPDFEFENHYVEIKGLYTYDLLLKNHANQLFKIKEISNSIKPIKILVLNNKGEILIEILLNSKQQFLKHIINK